ncbi:MAG: GntR family transcriptional regulator [Armatimonadota bacterium]|nr:GntR family transcriptional regulator [Armatimonadota bacterium]MDR7531722.1 GntR family transcriptional regulator [Armatimonadota bacterium]MDR7534934.1 GntR family transcriptional regulator [Armatimonadota bacterium]
MVQTGRSSKEAAYAQLKRAILTAAVRPGEPFSERVLAARFHLSRTPIREILRRLQHEHLVELVPRRGAFVRRLDPQEVLEIFQARETVEPAAARLAAWRADAGVLRRLRRQFDALELADRPAALAAMVAAGRRLHDAIVAACGNRYLREMYEILSAQTARVRQMTREHFEIERESYRWHVRILEALRRGDADRAEGAMREHLRVTREALLRWLLAPEQRNGEPRAVPTRVRPTRRKRHAHG